MSRTKRQLILWSSASVATNASNWSPRTVMMGITQCLATSQNGTASCAEVSTDQELFVVLATKKMATIIAPIPLTFLVPSVPMQLQIGRNSLPLLFSPLLYSVS